MSNEVVVVALDKRYKKLSRELAGRAEKILKFLKRKNVRVEVYLVGIPRMKALNRRHRGKNKATDVLAFSAPAGFPAPRALRHHLGEIYLCPPYVKAHREDIGALLAHGMLHLTGFNHAGVNDRIAMEKKEMELLAWLNR